jgi:hypothetical protein
MKTPSFLTDPRTGARIWFVVIGVVFLVLSINEMLWQRWIFAAIQASLGLGLLLVGTLSSTPLGCKTSGDCFKLVLWNMGFAAGFVVVVVFVNRSGSELIHLSLPYLAALWLLAVGACFAKRRISVIAVAVIASLLLLLQCAIFSIGIVLSPYHLDHRTQFQVLLVAVIATGVVFVGWFIKAKQSKARIST